ATQVSVGNCVTSLRLLSSLDWAAFFESTSLVESVLRDDPTGVYARQDFATRDRYRRTVERLARGSRFTELEVARRAVALANRAECARAAAGPEQAPQTPQPRHCHVGYFLIDRGRPELEADLG